MPAGALNLGNEVWVYATKDSYNSTINQIIFRSNRALEPAPSKENKFHYFYIALVTLGIILSVIIPLSAGVLTTSLFLQNITGILFAVCPCTIAIAQQFPRLLSVYRRHNKGIYLRNEELTQRVDEIDTVVFDKTGTLTTGLSEVESCEGISASLWQRIYLLEKNHVADHPLARAITHFYEAHINEPLLLKEVTQFTRDVKNRGMSATVQGIKMHVGSLAYLQEAGVTIPEKSLSLLKNKLNAGYTPVYVAENTTYQGIILIKHALRKNILPALFRLKKAGKKIIMLTGDNLLSAKGFNKQHASVFNENNIYADQTPQDKELFLSKLMDEELNNPQGVWFIGDGLNDAPCARIVTEKGGMSCAMTANDKAAFFTDLSLNGSIDYVFQHNKLNKILQKITLQNKLLIAYSTIIFLAFIISFSTLGIAVSPLIPLCVMSSTTLMVLFNSYRAKFSADVALDKNTAWIKRMLASDLSTGMVVVASALFACGLLAACIASGGFILPVFIFNAGIIPALSSICVLTATALVGIFAFIGMTYVCSELTTKAESAPQSIKSKSLLVNNIKEEVADNQAYHSFNFKTNSSNPVFFNDENDCTEINSATY